MTWAASSPRQRFGAAARWRARTRVWLVREYGEALLLGLVALLALSAILTNPADVPQTVLLVPLIIGSLVLGPRQLPWFVIWVLLLLCVSVYAQTDITTRIVFAVVVQFLIAFIVLMSSFRRSRLGVAGARGESMFVDLRDRLLNQAGIPSLPAGWHVESALRSAGGTPFAGDFMVATTVDDGRRLEVVVVDVSGKGEEAGTRALLLSGAFGGLLGGLPPERFLAAANDYLVRQGWEEGFATAIHLTLDLASGRYEVRTAGHPPAAHRNSGSGRWEVLPSSGPVLGLIDDVEFTPAVGTLGHGDAVLLYTDGMVEIPRRDIELGLDRMLGEAERLLRGDFEGSAQRLVDALGSRNDDRALLVVHRR